MMDDIARGVRETSDFVGRSHLDPAVHDAMLSVPRHEFVPVDLQDLAYENRPLPIGHDQTISQPYIVAIMSDLARLAPDSHVLEIGTGCGYQAAVLAYIAGRVTSVERIAMLADTARARLRRLGHANVQVYNADGAKGWPADAPYDAIIVTAAAVSPPDALIAQLGAGGRMIIPLGKPAMIQSLTVFELNADRSLHESCHLPVAFVPLIGGISVP